MIKQRRSRRALAASLIGLGIVLIFFATSSGPGLLLMGVGTGLEILGMHLERSNSA